MKNLLPTLALSAAAAVAFVAPSADAGSVHYLDGKGGLAKSHTIVSDGVTITATATATKNGKSEKAHVGQYSHGLGVTNSVYKYKNWWGQTKIGTTDGSHTVDGKGMDDTLWLSFDSPFQVAGAIFTYVGSRNKEGVTVLDGDGNTLGRYNLSKIAKCGVACLDLSDLDYTGTKIGFAATGNHDSWKVKGIKGHAVPTPSAAAAGLIGLAGLAARRRRRTENDN